MTERENQSSSDNTTPRYRALVDGTGYKEGDILCLISTNFPQNLIDAMRYYSNPDLNAPVFDITQLAASPDFELVEEYWEPKHNEPFYTIGKHGVVKKFRLIGDNYTDSEWKEALSIGFIFRTMDDLLEAIDLIKKRSKESRGLNAE